ncbi:MAG: hypothetical protein H6627_09100 [Calditrichae bacterium]|nr:hypothetical protein [Calditrichota bacterium]MCB9058711.1 hypothetical protein [Calditrichia bacterium]
MKKFNSLAISNADDLIFGNAQNPVKCGNGMVIGDGVVFPEINFTLPSIKISGETWKEVLQQYREIADNISRRARALKAPGFVVEFEQLPPMTQNPQMGAEITEILKNALNQLYQNDGIKNALRVTVVDLRDADRPPQLRDGNACHQTLSAFELSAQAGADILSIESVGGKEIHDQALMYADLKGIIASLGILAYRDVSWLWQQIKTITNRYNIIAGGDTACGFANTAMQLAGQGMLPDILAALVRAASVPRSLAAYENGAIGPSKDCAYEGPYIKAITGTPISMEGKSSCCAHFSPLGNIAAAAADLWSNESVQNVRLLSGNAPEVFYELLEYDCRLFNTATKHNTQRQLRELFVQSDIRQNIQALMLEPETVLKISRAIVEQTGGYNQTLAAAKTAFHCMQQAADSGLVHLSEIESSWFLKLKQELDEVPVLEDEALNWLYENYGSLFIPESYNLKNLV